LNSGVCCVIIFIDLVALCGIFTAFAGRSRHPRLFLMNEAEKKLPIDWKPAAVLSAAGVIIYSILTFYFPYVSSDGFLYLDLAGNLFDKGLVADSEPREKFLPFYPFLLAVVHIGSGKMLELSIAAHAVDIACGALVSSLVFLLAFELGASRRTAFLFGFVQLALPLGMDQYRDVSVLPLFTLQLCLLLFFIKRERLLWAGIVAGIAVTTRYEAYLFLPFFLLVNLKRPKRLAYSAAGFLPFALFWWVRNLIKFGNVFHTLYMAELTTRLAFHLDSIGLGLVWEFGPFVLLLGGFGIARLSGAWKAYIIGFPLLYIALHTTWWFYDNRFLLSLCPFILPVAAVGADAAIKWTEERKPGKKKALLVVMIVLVAVPLVSRQACYFYKLGNAELGPYRQAAEQLKKVPASVAFLGSRDHIIEHYSGHRAYTWKLMGDADPHQYVLKHYLEKDVGMVVWTNTHPLDYQRFPFLRQGKDFTVMVDLPEGSYSLTYQYYATFGELPRIVHVYNVLVKKTE